MTQVAGVTRERDKPDKHHISATTLHDTTRQRPTKHFQINTLGDPQRVASKLQWSKVKHFAENMMEMFHDHCEHIDQAADLP